MPAPRIPRLPNRTGDRGPTHGYVGFAWCDFDETIAGHAARLIERTRNRGAHVAAVLKAFSWNDDMASGARPRSAVHHVQPGLNT